MLVNKKHALGSRMRMQGILTIHVRDAKTTNVLRTIIKRNTITFSAGDVVRALLAQRATDASAAELCLGSMRFGISSTTPTRYDTDLQSEISTVRRELTDDKKVNGVTGEISLRATMEASAGNGYTYREAGLFTKGTVWDAAVGGNLQCFSRQVHAAVEKTASLALEYNWVLQFTV
ncbi:MAG: hypothetical protein PVI90_06365 [Desulfobacteraceae bacterium]|jgi:hypothetical protein